MLRASTSPLPVGVFEQKPKEVPWEVSVMKQPSEQSPWSHWKVTDAGKEPADAHEADVVFMSLPLKGPPVRMMQALAPH